MNPLDKKLLRDLWRIKGQAVAIIMVIALGVLMLVMMGGLINSLEETKRAYYERYRLADIFAPTKRAPNHLLKDITRIPSVASVEGRINGGALIDLPAVTVPIRAKALSLPESGTPRLNDVYLADGRRLDPTRDDEILLLRGFAKANGISPGARLTATMNGARRTFTVVGLAEAPEFLYAVAPGEIAPNDARFAVIWMNEDALAAAYDLKGAFNEVLVSLSRGAREPAILDQLDRILEPYGGTGAYGLKDHPSNRFVVDEIAGLRTSSSIVPPIFLAVAAFLLYIVISRMIQAEREQIGLLKAFGYSSFEVATHYFKFILTIAVLGAMLGCLFGVLSGRSMAVVYQGYFKFPFLVFQVEPRGFVIGFVSSVLAASAGGLVVLRQVFDLTPAVAMRPPVPADFSKAFRFGPVLKSVLDQPSRMVLRRLIRQPVRAFTAVAGIAASVALTVAQLSIIASFDRMLDLNYRMIDRGDVAVSFVEPLGDASIFALRRMPGVIDVEPYRSVSVILRNGRYTYRGAINGLVSTPRLNRAVDSDMEAIYVRRDGLILSKALAKTLNVTPGQTLTIEVREGRRPVLQIPVVGVAETLFGAPAYFEINALNTALKEPNRVSGAYLRIDTAESATIYRTIKDIPIVAGVSVRAETRDALKRMLDSGAGAVRFIMAAIAAIITFGIVYNSARIAFAERERDLASLRVLGFTKGEAAFVLLGELAIVTLLALPLGSVGGYFLSQGLAEGFSTDLYQIPALFTPEAHGTAALAVLLAAAVSGWLVKRDVDRMDLVSALKTRE